MTSSLKPRTIRAKILGIPGKDGEPGLRWAGEFNINSEYSYPDVVEYDGSSYVYIGSTPSTGILPTNTAYWKLVVSKGEPGLTWKGDYDNSIQYESGDVVFYNGSSYVYINDTPSTGNLPTDTAYWDILAQQGAGFTGSPLPSGGHTGDVLVKLSDADGDVDWENGITAVRRSVTYTVAAEETQNKDDYDFASFIDAVEYISPLKMIKVTLELADGTHYARKYTVDWNDTNYNWYAKFEDVHIVIKGNGTNVCTITTPDMNDTGNEYGLLTILNGKMSVNNIRIELTGNLEQWCDGLDCRDNSILITGNIDIANVANGIHIINSEYFTMEGRINGVNIYNVYAGVYTRLSVFSSDKEITIDNCTYGFNIYHSTVVFTEKVSIKPTRHGTGMNLFGSTILSHNTISVDGANQNVTGFNLSSCKNVYLFQIDALNTENGITLDKSKCDIDSITIHNCNTGILAQATSNLLIKNVTVQNCVLAFSANEMSRYTIVNSLSVNVTTNIPFNEIQEDGSYIYTISKPLIYKYDYSTINNTLVPTFKNTDKNDTVTSRESIKYDFQKQSVSANDSIASYVLPLDAMIVGYSVYVENDNTNQKALDLYINDTLNTTLYTTSGSGENTSSDMSLSINTNTNDKITVKSDSNAGTLDNVVLNLFVRWRAS